MVRYKTNTTTTNTNNKQTQQQITPKTYQTQTRNKTRRMAAARRPRATPPTRARRPRRARMAAERSHRWNKETLTATPKFSKLAFLIYFVTFYVCLNWLSGALVGVGGSDFIGYEAPALRQQPKAYPPPPSAPAAGPSLRFPFFSFPSPCFLFFASDPEVGGEDYFSGSYHGSVMGRCEGLCRTAKPLPAWAM